MLKHKIAALGTTLTTGLLLASTSHAALDVTAAVDTLAEGVVAAGLIGVAYLGFTAVVKIWKRLGSAT